MKSSTSRSNVCVAGGASAITEEGDGPREAPRAGRCKEASVTASPPSVAGNETDTERGLYTPHPLFPREAGACEAREIAYLIFLRRPQNSQVELCPQRFEAKDITSWDDVVRRWGGGDYKVLGFSSERALFVDVYPRAASDWKHCEGPSRPFTLSEAGEVAASPPVSDSIASSGSPPARVADPGTSQPARTATSAAPKVDAPASDPVKADRARALEQRILDACANHRCPSYNVILARVGGRRAVALAAIHAMHADGRIRFEGGLYRPSASAGSSTASCNGASRPCVASNAARVVSSAPSAVAENADAGADGGSDEDVFYPRHPLFPRAPGAYETRQIAYVMLLRKRPDGGKAAFCPVVYDASAFASWDDVVRQWGGGDYKAVAQDSWHRIVACSPPEAGAWMHFDGASVPFARSSHEEPAEKYSFPLLAGLTPEAIALCAVASAAQSQCAEHEALLAASDRSLPPDARALKVFEAVEAHGAVVALRGLAYRIVRLLAARVLENGGAP
jgi:hypothetical protein